MVNIAFFMIFAVLDPSPLTVCINCSFFTFIGIAAFEKYEVTYILKTLVICGLFIISSPGIAMP